MTKIKPSFLLLAVLLLTASEFLVITANEKESLNKYQGEIVLPEALYQTYEEFVAALENGKLKEIEKFCIPEKIKITTDPRPIEKKNYGSDINIPFLKDGFDKFIQSLGKVSDTKYLIRTGSTALWFTKTKNEKWQLSEYFDKPIE